MRFLSLIPILLLSAQSFAQFHPAAVLTHGENMEVNFEMDKGIFYYHTIKAKQTLYSISKFFGINVNELRYMNNLSKNSVVSIGQRLIIPLNYGLLDVTDQGNGNNPIYYKVKAGETLFRIAKVYFNQPVEALVARNNLADVSLNVGDLLIVGYLEEHPIIVPPDEQAGNPKIDADIADSNVVDESTGSPAKVTMIRRKGVAIWNKEGKDYDNAYVLHKFAKPNTIIELYNPVVKRRTFAKVVGKLPEDIYEDDVVVIISPKVAKNLGALDSRLSVEMSYRE